MKNKKDLEELYGLYQDKIHSAILTEDISQIRKEIINKTEEIFMDLSKDKQDLIERILELEHERGALEDKEVFIFGFSLAIRLFVNGI